MGRTILLTAAAAFVAGAMPARADLEEQCLKRLSVVGRPHHVKTLAQLNAVRAWVNKAAKKGKAYAKWHNARSAGVQCEQMGSSIYHKCTAAAEPCRDTTTVAETTPDPAAKKTIENQ